MNVPTLFGCPLWFGKIKRRVAKKYLNRWSIRYFLKKCNAAPYSNLDVGDMVNDCTGRNGKIVEIEPVYKAVAGGYVLIDIDVRTTNTGCSFMHCGVEPALSREVIEKKYISFMDEWFFGEGGKTWYGGLDNPKYQQEITLAKKKYETIKNGGHIVDEAGVLLPEFTPNFQATLL